MAEKNKIELAEVIHLLDDSHLGVMRIVINKGGNHGVKWGDTFLVFGVGPHLTDPESGADLGALEIVRGRGKVIHVQPGMSTLESVEKKTAKRRIITESPYLTLFGQKTIEEVPETGDVPFNSVAKGDKARPV